MGEVAFGYRRAEDGVHVEPEPTEQATISIARALHATGLSIRTVAAKLDELGHRGRTGRALSHTQIHRIVRSAA